MVDSHLRPRTSPVKAPLAVLLTLVAAGCSHGADAPATHPKTILVIRHAEKPEAEADVGLSPAGKKRAEALPHLFEKSAARPDPFPTPDFIFAARASKHSDRPVATVTPLAKKLKLDVNADYPNEDYPKLVRELFSDPKYGGKTVLICWHHGSIPELASKLGAADVPEKWKDQVFDRVWVVTFDDKGNAKALAKKHQALGPGDEKE